MSNSNSKTGRPWVIVLFFTLFMAIMTYNLVIYPACAVSTMAVFGIKQAELTTLSSVTSLVGVFAGIIFGRILDEKDVRKNMILFMAIGVALFFVRAFIMLYIPTLILTFLASFSIGICQVAAPKVVASWYPPEKVGTATSFFVAGSGLGSAGGFAIGAILGIQRALLSIGIAYLLLLLFWIAVGYEGPYKQASQPAASQGADKSSAGRVYKSKYLWFIILAYSLAMTSSLTLNTYMINAFIGKGLTGANAAMMGTFFNISLLAGGFIMTALLGIVRRFNPLLAVAMIGGGAFVLIGYILPISSVTWICVILGGLFFGGSLGLCVGRIPLLPMTGDFGPELIGTASGFTETIKGIISFVLPIALAYMFGTNYKGIFIAFAICCLLTFLFGGLLMPELGEKGKLFQQNNAGKR